MPKSPFESLLDDHEIIQEIKVRSGLRGGIPQAESLGIGLETVRRAASGERRGLPLLEPEAIIVQKGRPSLLIQNGCFAEPEMQVWAQRLNPFRVPMESAISAIGRIEVENHPQLPFIGTGWLIAPDVLVTNRHVALEFSRYGSNGTFPFLRFLGREMRVRIDFAEEYQVDRTQEHPVQEVALIEPLSEEAPDLAVLKLKTRVEIPPLALADEPRHDRYIAVIGYPARDSRNDADALLRVFGDIYNVKRLAPGQRMTEDYGHIFTHDCSTLGGNSGSAIIDVETGRCVGLHFAGSYEVANYAVKGRVLQDKLRSFVSVHSVRVPHDSGNVPAHLVMASLNDRIEPQVERPQLDDYEGRHGYEPDFLGERVPLPDLSPGHRQDVATVRGRNDGVLPYQHFSVVMNARRRLAFYTAVNIDGGRIRRLRRRRHAWLIDPRIESDHQADNELYFRNDLDRGHLVRRLDPMWGDNDEVRDAQEDTFHFTNAAPQHAHLNQREWLELESYLLDNADAHDFKISVFTGPIFRNEDQEYRGYKLPQHFWKVVAFRTSDDQLAATGYVLSQVAFLKNLEFAFGAFGTYQTAIADIEELTGLRFGRLRENDPFGQMESPRQGVRARRLDSLGDILVKPAVAEPRRDVTA